MNRWIFYCVISWILFSIIFYFSYFTVNLTLGPNEHLIIINININNYLRYFLVMLYLFINTIIRTINTDFIKPWIILNLQNKIVLLDISNTFCYNIIIISTLYVYFDWYLSLVLIFTQLDVVLSSIIMEVISQIIMCRYYLKKKNFHINLSADNLNSI